jgi:hypothetical protein
MLAYPSWRWGASSKIVLGLGAADRKNTTTSSLGENTLNNSFPDCARNTLSVDLEDFTLCFHIKICKLLMHNYHR